MRGLLIFLCISLLVLAVDMRAHAGHKHGSFLKCQTFWAVEGLVAFAFFAVCVLGPN
jgi:hypothetical protein